MARRIRQILHYMFVYYITCLIGQAFSRGLISSDCGSEAEDLTVWYDLRQREENACTALL